MEMGKVHNGTSALLHRKNAAVHGKGKSSLLHRKNAAVHGKRHCCTENAAVYGTSCAMQQYGVQYKAKRKCSIVLVHGKMHCCMGNFIVSWKSALLHGKWKIPLLHGKFHCCLENWIGSWIMSLLHGKLHSFMERNSREVFFMKRNSREVLSIQRDSREVLSVQRNSRKLLCVKGESFLWLMLYMLFPVCSDMICYALLSSVMLCSFMFSCAILWYALPWSDMNCYALLCSVMLWTICKVVKALEN